MNGELDITSKLPPTTRPKTVGELQVHTEAIGQMVSTILTELASGKYDKEVALTEELLAAIGAALPPFGAVEKGLEIFLWINRVTAPAGPIVPDGHGGWVPQTNSRYDPRTGRFL